MKPNESSRFKTSLEPTLKLRYKRIDIIHLLCVYLNNFLIFYLNFFLIYIFFLFVDDLMNSNILFICHIYMVKIIWKRYKYIKQ